MLVPHLKKIYFGTSGLTLVSSNDKITIKIGKKKIIQNKNLGCQMNIRETNSDYEMEKR